MMPAMPSLVFLQPLFLLASLAAGIPVIVHLIHRRKRQRIRFSTVRFLVATDRRSARKYNLVDLLVLLLRMLVLLFLTMALAQPVVRPPGAADMAFGKVCLGIVLDDSMSMQRTADGVRLFDRALEAVRTVLGEAPQDAEAFVVLASGRTPLTLSAPTTPPASLADALSGTECSYSGRPVARAIGEALTTFAASKSRHRALLVVTDMQSRAFEGMASVDPEALRREVRSVQVLEVAGPPDNLALTDLALSSRVCFPGTPVRVRATVLSTRGAPEDTEVSLWAGESKVQGQPVSVPAGGTAEVVFTHVANEPGNQRLAVRLEPDALAGDNARFDALRVLPQVETMIVAPPAARPAVAGAVASGEVGASDETIFLQTALNPLRTPNFAGSAPVLVHQEDYETVRTARLDPYAMLFVIDNGQLPERVMATLKTYAERGGQVVFFPARSLVMRASGAGSNNSALLDARGPAGKRYAWLPLGEVWTQEADAALGGFGNLDATHPFFALLSRSAPDLFNAVAFHAYLRLGDRDLGSTDRVLARLKDGSPLLVEERVGKGFLYAWTSGCHPDWSDLPLRPLFLPLLFESLKAAVGGAGNAVTTANVDEGFALSETPSPEARMVRVVQPSGHETQALLSAGRDTLECADASVPGVYEVHLANTPGPGVLVPLNADGAESKLDRMAPEAVAGLFPKDLAPVFEASASAAARRLAYSTHGLSLSGWLLAGALIALLGEIYLSNVLLRNEEERPGWVRRLVRRLGWA